jgi:hypothetical protein
MVAGLRVRHQQLWCNTENRDALWRGLVRGPLMNVGGINARVGLLDFS